MRALGRTFLERLEGGPLPMDRLFRGRPTVARRRAVCELLDAGLVEHVPPVDHEHVVYRLTRAGEARQAE